MPESSDLSIQSLFSITGWVAIVTGGGTGLGLITAKALAENGARVYITGRRLEVLKKAESQVSNGGGAIIALEMDVTNKDSIRAGVAEISKREKCVHLLVNNAGVTCKHADIDQVRDADVEAISAHMFDTQEYEDWSWPYAVNVASYYFCSAAFLPLLVRAREQVPASGSIINISSISGVTKESQAGQYSYNASKAACISLTEQLACDFKRPGLEIRVNTLAPGYFPSQMTVIDDEDGDKAHFRKEWGIPAGRPGRARDYAQAVLNFAVNGYVTGATLVIDGGWLLAHA